MVTVLEEGQNLFAFLFFVVGIPFFQAALDAIPFGLALVILLTALFVHGQVAVGIGDRFLA
jgi:hypothetical protein